MNPQATFALRSRNLDVLTCIANLSNDEVITPPEFANTFLEQEDRGEACDKTGWDAHIEQPTGYTADPLT